MGAQTNQKKKKKASERTTGKRKSKKGPAESEPEENPPPPAPKPRPLPRLKLRGPTLPANSEGSPRRPATAQEDDAVAALVAMGANAQPPAPPPAASAPSAASAPPPRISEFDRTMDQVFKATVPGGDSEEEDGGKGVSSDRAEEKTDSESESDESESSSDSDSEDDQLLDIGTPFLANRSTNRLTLCLVHVSSPAREAQARKKKVSITFVVPVGNASREFDVDSDISFDKFLSKVARTMETRKTLLSGIAYIPSYVPKNPKPIPKLLESAKAWKKLIKGVELHIEESTKKAKGKGKGKGAVKEFSIQIVDTSNPSDPKKAAVVKKVSCQLSCDLCLRVFRARQIRKRRQL